MNNNKACGMCDYHKLLPPDSTGGDVYGCRLRNGKVIEKYSCRKWQKYLGGGEIGQEKRLLNYQRHKRTIIMTWAILIIAFLTLLATVFIPIIIKIWI